MRLLNCLKCGKKLQGKDVFCQDCLSQGGRFPVDPATPVVLQPRAAESETKKKLPRKRPPEEQLLRMRLTLRRLTVVLMVSLLALALSLAVNLRLAGII